MAQELHFHDVNLVNRDTGDFCPGLVGIGVVVKDYMEDAD